MPISKKIFSKLRETFKGTTIIYPIIIITLIPLLLIINTLWNLKTFNRDINYFIRHQAISISETIKPQILSSINQPVKIQEILDSAILSNSDIKNVSLLKENQNNLEVISFSGSASISEVEKTDLNKLALSLNQSFAGLTYDQQIEENVWNVAVPLDEVEGEKYVLFTKIGISTANEILQRTSRDSYIILIILISVTIILLVNHFIFFLKAQKTKQLEEIDKLKDEFISMAAHELKTPVTALIGYLELLKDNIQILDKSKIKENFEILNGLTWDLGRLINDLLEVSRIEQNRFKIQIEQTDVNKVVKKCVDNLSPMAKNKKLQIQFDPGNTQIINSDPNRLQQIITNLISNSIKYTLAGKITIQTKLIKANKYIEISVEDTGIGIPAEEIQNLFSKFHRIKDKKTQEERGTGLGLWITKKITNLLNGNIYVESIYGKGTKFTINLPVS